jgi:hypothetical protein
MKHLICVGMLLLTAATIYAQEVKLKKEVVYVDGTPTFSYAKKSMGGELYVYKLNTKEEVVSMHTESNGTESNVDDSKKIVFAEQKITIQNKNFRSQNWDFLISSLINEKVIDLNGNINLDNLKHFRAKYDENSINHTEH